MESLYDTRFFFEHYYSKDAAVLRWTRKELGSGTKYASVVTAHELYKISLEGEGRETAELRTMLMEKEFELIEMGVELAKESAMMRSRYRIPMADSIIAASAKLNRLECVSDDPHLRAVREIKTRWLR